ncbi:hypothetical protein [Methylocapsa palsarum]|uniref:Uncharacterized protein n=1 Tax=Methylocapsa palsarum TaxID=1612308 RepID=A0A1I3YVX7_9HYPH|nr:hypothetical protein [Methylocapsa palsarum]SFK35940.1 hypothetical protein SAMN05444581_106223 [Methylocapsa palsarum]
MLSLQARKFHDATVIGVEDIMPRMRRVTVARDCLSTIQQCG